MFLAYTLRVSNVLKYKIIRISYSKSSVWCGDSLRAHGDSPNHGYSKFRSQNKNGIKYHLNISNQLISLISHRCYAECSSILISEELYYSFFFLFSFQFVLVARMTWMSESFLMASSSSNLTEVYCAAHNTQFSFLIRNSYGNILDWNATFLPMFRAHSVYAIWMWWRRKKKWIVLLSCIKKAFFVAKPFVYIVLSNLQRKIASVYIARSSVEQLVFRLLLKPFHSLRTLLSIFFLFSNVNHGSFFFSSFRRYGF